MLKITKLVFNPFQVNTYLAWDSESSACAIIDPGCLTTSETARLHDAISKAGLRPVAVLLTHCHLDHICGLQNCVDTYGIPVYMDPREEEVVTGFNPTMFPGGMSASGQFPYVAVKEGDTVEIGSEKFRALSTPGHTMGGLCWWNEAGVIFSGDTLFAGAIGRTDNKWADWGTLISSIKNTLMVLDGTVDVFPGHGPATSIGQERITNPFIVDEFGPNGYEE